MFEDLFGEVDATVSGFIESDAFQIGIRVLVRLHRAHLAGERLLGLPRHAPALGERLHAVPRRGGDHHLHAHLLPLRAAHLPHRAAQGDHRPRSTSGCSPRRPCWPRWRSHAHCANCSRPVHEEWIICPTCRNRLRRVCPNCERLIELDWTLCAWCGKDFERAEAPGLAAYMPSARPAPRPPQQAPVRIPPPPPPLTRGAPVPSQPSPAGPTGCSRHLLGQRRRPLRAARVPRAARRPAAPARPRRAPSRSPGSRQRPATP